MCHRSINTVACTCSVYLCCYHLLSLFSNGADSKPTITQLTVLKNSRGEKVEIIKTIAPDWMEVGILMDLDPKGKKVATIEAEHAHKRNGPVTCCRAMFTLWLDQPAATWGNLVKLFVDAEHKELAGQVQDALC